jgi:hypothetical protein
MATGKAPTRKPLIPDANSRGGDPVQQAPPDARAREILTCFNIAFILSSLQQGKQLQLWDSNIHYKATQCTRT